jgi:hypothetical protein
VLHRYPCAESAQAKKKPPEGGVFYEAEKITSSLQQVRQQERQQVQQQEQQVLQQQEQQRVQQQERLLLFYRKRPEQQPTKLPRGVTFSWKFPLSDAKTLQGLPQALT